MSTIGEQIFNGLYSGMPDARCNVRKGRDTVDRALASGIGRDHQMTDQGTYKGVDLTVRVLSSELPERSIDIGDVVEVRQPADTEEWQSFRVAGRNVTGGVVSYTMAAEHE